jgi:aminoglycoside phosphotransferase (APT) family kinase protein
MTAPPAEGVRVDWESVPGPVRAGIEQICGSPVVRARSQPGGFSPGLAARLECADGSRWFVKAVSSAANPDTPAIHRREARILQALDPMIVSGALPAPRLRGTLDAQPWTALILDDIDGRHPRLPWESADLTAVMAAVDALTDAFTPSPIEAPSVAEYFAADFAGWRTLAAAADPGAIDTWSRTHLHELAELEHDWPRHLAGQTLLHADVRADNLLLTRQQSDIGNTADGRDHVVFIDWPHACTGATFAEVVFMAPCVTMQGGPPPAELLSMTRAGRHAHREAVAAAVCAIAGYLTERSLRPAPPGLPTVRAFQAAQGKIARRWLADLL